MIAVAQSTVVIGAVVCALWLATAVFATLHGLRKVVAARKTLAGARRLAALLGGGPALPMLVAGDGGVAADARLADRLGLAHPLLTLGDLGEADGGGLAADDLAALLADIGATRTAASGFTRSLRVGNSTRTLMAHGRPGEEAGEVVVWFIDATDSETEIARLRDEGARLSQAVEGVSALIEAAPFPMWHRGPDLRLALVNSAYVTAVEGSSAADVVARGLELVEGKGGRGPLAAAAAVRESGQITIRTAPATIGGTRRTLRIVDVPIGEAGVAGYAIDVEELEEARADLGRFVRAQHDMLDLLSAGVAQFGPDRALVFTNQPFARLFALKPEWLADRPEFDRVLERMRESGRLPESRDFPGWKAERRRWFNAADDLIEENWLLPGGAHLRVLVQPLPDGGLLLIFEDRTEQVQLASARDTLLRVRTATFDNLFEAVGVFAADGRLQLWNNRFRDAWGLTEQELAQHPRVDALVEAAAKRLANPSRASLIRELVRIATTERQQRSGRVAFVDGRDFEFIAVPLPDGNALFTMLDITDSRRIERALRDRNEALEESDRLKTAFVANMSYELRTPLTSIGGFAEMLAGGYAGPMGDVAADYVAAILESVGRLGLMIDEVLDLTQVEAGNPPMMRQPVDLVALARTAAAACGEAAAARSLDLAVSIDPSVGAVEGDPRRLRQAMDHLLGNAVAYTPRGGRVLFRAEGDSEAAQIVVSDNGPGISPEDRERIFTRFERVGPRPNDGKPAAGIGLPLTRQFVEAHGGTLTLISEPGEGTTLIIWLPRRG
ncbi:PAS domain-containing sensor histidine kinase [Sphingomonas solaris]|uniref:histidine kinase n=1 Tax=Alterirhizorhabdus solaris TaxID=2529389 RepID=A0A558R1G4_9SPHN|nr:PAS domain-containing sensor histidine kinase [Sphingomonas solaris]TVV73217.1 histidine kinase [Sphingomonas solaris]